MKYQNRELTELTLNELAEASFKLQAMETELNKKREHPKFKKQMLGQPEPGINPAFVELQTAINDEIKKRKE